jgi:hypothetical protein
MRGWFWQFAASLAALPLEEALDTNEIGRTASKTVIGF